MDSRKKARHQSAMIAFCGMTVALSVVLLLLGGVIPVATYAVPMFTGLLLLPVLLEFGYKAAWTTFFATALLSLFLDFDKEASFFYLFIGYYPIIKWRLDRLQLRIKILFAKLAIFVTALGMTYGLLALLLPTAAAWQEFGEMGTAMMIAFVVLFLFCLMLYDRLLTPLALLYVRRIQPKLKVLKRK